MKTYILDLSLKQDSFPRFKSIVEDLVEVVYVPGFSPPYPNLHTSDAVILTGSEHSIFADYPWLSFLMDWIKEFSEKGNAILGVCYGHQLIARSFLGLKALGRLNLPEMTFTEIEILDEHPLFKNIPNPFLSMSSHYDEVKLDFLIDDFKVIACSKDCSVQAMVHKQKKVIGIQFHPEIGLKTAKRCIEIEADKLKQFGLNLAELYNRIPKKSTGVDRIIRNFFKYCIE